MTQVALELGRWTIRVNGRFVADFHCWREGKARRTAMLIADAIEYGRQREAAGEASGLHDDR